MAVEILPGISSQMASAQRIVETLVFRTNQGAVFTIDIGESIMANPLMEAMVTLQVNPPMHVGICEGATIEEVRMAAQQLIETTISNGLAKPAVPASHFAPSKNGFITEVGAVGFWKGTCCG